MKKVLVTCEYFRGTVMPGGEYIHNARQGDIITVQDSTWVDMQRVFPEWFSLIADTPEVIAEVPEKALEEFTEASIVTPDFSFMEFEIKSEEPIVNAPKAEYTPPPIEERKMKPIRRGKRK